MTIVMLYAHLHPVQLTPLQVETTGGQCGTRLAKTPPPMTASQPTSITSYKHSITDVNDHTLFLDHPISNSVEPAIPTDGSSLCSPMSEDAMQPLPMRGRVQVRDEHGHCHWPLSIESSFTLYDCSSGSRASSSGMQTPNSHAQCQPINNSGYDDHGYFSPDDNDHTLNACRHQPPSPPMFDNEGDTSSSSCMEPSISPALSSNLCQDSTPLLSHSTISSKRRCSSLPPTFHQLEDICGQQFLRSQPNIPEVTANMQLPSPSKMYQPNPNMQDKQLQTESLPLPGDPMVNNKQNPSSTTLSRPSLASVTSSQKYGTNDQHGYSLPDDNNFSTLAIVSQVMMSASSIHTTGEFQLKAMMFASTQYLISMVMETDKGPDTSYDLGMESGFENSPMAKLLREYRAQDLDSQGLSTETMIQSILNVNELGPEMIMDRGSERAPRLPRYHLVEAMINNLTVVVTAQQIFLQQAAALIMDRTSYFKVDPGDTLIPILQGTSSLPQLYTAWRALITRIKLGVKAWQKYIAEYQLQVGPAALSSLSTLPC